MIRLNHEDKDVVCRIHAHQNFNCLLVAADRLEDEKVRKEHNFSTSDKSHAYMNQIHNDDALKLADFLVASVPQITLRRMIAALKDHPGYEHHRAKFKNTSMVIVTDEGDVFTTYEAFARRHIPEGYIWATDAGKEYKVAVNRCYTVIASGDHDTESEVVYLIADYAQKVYIMGEKGLKQFMGPMA